MTSQNSTRRPETLAAHGAYGPEQPFRDIAPPLHLSTTFERDTDGGLPGGRMYSRASSPAYDAAEALLTQLEGGAAAVLFSSGMAAASAVFMTLRPGARVVAPTDMYWGLRNWLIEFAGNWKMTLDFYDPLEGDLAEKLRTPADIVWVETPANPTWEITDIAAAAELAHAAGARLVTDSTVATPVLTRPLELGADIVMHSGTKYLNGHSDVIAGALVTKAEDDFWARIKRVRVDGGAVLGPFEAWLLARGMRTLFPRVRTASVSALAIARHFERHDCVAKVLYPGLPGHAGHEIAARQMQGGFGGMLSLRNTGGRAAASAFASRLKVFRRATSLGSVESLVEHRVCIEGPGTRCPEDLLRLSVGIEHPQDLIDDIESALTGG